MERNGRKVREAAVAGRFYSAEPEELAVAVDAYVGAARGGVAGCRPKALIAPHAGYVFSGPVAGSAFATLIAAGEATAEAASDARELGTREVRRVVLVGPSHFVAFDGVALPGAEAFRTPLGDLELDGDGVDEAGRLPFVVERPDAHAREHCLEVELPFLQRTLAAPAIVPLVTGTASAEQVAEAIGLLWGGDETLIVVSSDLSHYLDHASARAADGATAEAIVELRAEELGPGDACGEIAIRGLLLAARARGLTGRTLGLRNSGDTGGPRDRVVGYGAFAFF